MNWLSDYLQSYAHRAMLEALLVGALAGAVGVHVVLRRLSFFTMAMTHATFPGVVIAALLGVNLYLGGAIAGVICAGLITALARRRGQHNSTATGVVLAGGFALGVALLSAQAGFGKDLSAYLVGSILTVQNSDIVTTALVGLVIVAVLVALRKELTFGAFDLAGFRASGYPAMALSLLILLIVEAVIVTSVPAVGTILSVALVVAPAASARLWTDRIGAMTALAVVFGAACGLGGLALSDHYGVAAGGAITLLAAAVFAISSFATPILRKIPRYQAG